MPAQIVKFLGQPLVVGGWKHPYCFLGTPLVDRDRVQDFAAALADAIVSRAHGRYFALHRASDGPVTDAIRSAAAKKGIDEIFEECFERAALKRSDDGNYIGGLKSKRRSELKRQRRRLADHLDAEVVAVERNDDEAIEAFLLLEAAGWKGSNETAMASNDGTARFFREVCSRLAAEERLLIRSLEAEGRAAAMTVDLRAGDTVFGFKTAFDEELSQFSPGILLQIDNFTAFHERGSERLIDSCSEPGNETMKGLWPDRRPLVTLLLGRHTWTSGTLGGALKVAYDARRRRSPDG